MPQNGETMTEGGQKYVWQNDHWVPVVDGQAKPGHIPGASPEQIAEERRKAGFTAGSDFGAKMRAGAYKPPSMVQVDTSGIDAARGLSAQSYGQQQQALNLMRQRASGQGPSVGLLAGQANQDAAIAQMMSGRGGAMLPGSSGALFDANRAAVAQRTQEINQAQGGLGQGLSQMRGQSLQDLGQAYGARRGAMGLSLDQGQQNLERELRMQGLSLGGYQMDAAAQNEMANLAAGFYGDEMARQQAQQAALLGAFGSSAGAIAQSMRQGSHRDENPYGFDPKSGINRKSPY